MFLAISAYLKPLEQVDDERAEHLQWVEKRYENGDLLVSGRREPAVGGVLVVRAASIDALQALLRSDPFVISGMSHYEVIEFTPTPAALRTPGFAAFDRQAVTS